MPGEYRLLNVFPRLLANQTCFKDCAILGKGMRTFRKMLLGIGKESLAGEGGCEDWSQNMHTLMKPYWSESVFHMVPEGCLVSPPRIELGQGQLSSCVFCIYQ